MPHEQDQQEPLRTGILIASDLQCLFSGTFNSWTIAGWVGRHVPRRAGQEMPTVKGPREIQHVLIPKASDGPGGNRVWDKAAQLLAAGTLRPAALPSGHVSSPDAETVALELFDARGWRHRLIRTSRASWGYRLTEALGPAGFFAMLRHRLELEGTFKLHTGAVCIFTTAGTWRPIDVPSETMFFELARTRWKDPAARFARPGEGEKLFAEWRRGMKPPYVPPGYVAIVNPSKQPWLFSDPSSRPAGRVHSRHVIPKAHHRAAPKPLRTPRAKRRSSGEVPADPQSNSRVCL